MGYFLTGSVLRLGLSARLLAVFLLVIPLAAADWPMFRGPNGSGVSQTVRPPVDPRAGDRTETKGWLFKRSLPEVSSPLYYKGRLYLFKNGGIVTILDPSSGEIISQGRLREAIDQYYSSPVAAGGHIYIVSLGGKISVLRAGPEIDVVATHDLGEDCYATPALVGEELYVRTKESLVAFSRAGP